MPGLIEMTLYPHEWLWQHMKEYNRTAGAIAVAILLLLLSFYIWTLVLIYPTTDALVHPNVIVNEYSSLSLTPIVVMIFLIVLALYSVLISGRKGE